ncbi:MAG: hypothetical protein QOG90_2426 [Actinomycetota bacterium]
MRTNFRRVAVVAAVLAAGGFIGGSALAGPLDGAVSKDGGGPVADPSPIVTRADQTAKGAYSFADKALGLGGVRPAPLPGPTPGIRPEDIVDRAIQTVAAGLDDAAQGLGGVRVGPLPAPTPGIRPQDSANGAIRTTAATLSQASKTISQVEVGRIGPI